jgi:hypothetical protein
LTLLAPVWSTAAESSTAGEHEFVVRHGRNVEIFRGGGWTSSGKTPTFSRTSAPALRLLYASAAKFVRGLPKIALYYATTGTWTDDRNLCAIRDGFLARAFYLAHVRGRVAFTRSMEVLRADRFEEVSLSDWLAHSPIDMVAETLNLDPSVIAEFPKNRPGTVPDNGPLLMLEVEKLLRVVPTNRLAVCFADGARCKTSRRPRVWIHRDSPWRGSTTCRGFSKVPASK